MRVVLDTNVLIQACDANESRGLICDVVGAKDIFCNQTNECLPALTAQRKAGPCITVRDCELGVFKNSGYTCNYSWACSASDPGGAPRQGATWTYKEGDQGCCMPLQPSGTRCLWRIECQSGICQGSSIADDTKIFGTCK